LSQNLSLRRIYSPEAFAKGGDSEGSNGGIGDVSENYLTPRVGGFIMQNIMDY
jgi:hypothetical protein